MDTVQDQALGAYLKKTVTLALAGERLELAVSQSLFSSHQVDVGTVHLLKTLQTRLQGDGVRILDLGCGYGPIGLALGRLNRGAEVHLVDRDALAVRFAQHNAAACGLADVHVYGSLGYDDVRARDFDLIVSNIPGKAGTPAIRAMLLDAQAFLSPDGMAAVVVVSPLKETVTETLTRPDIEITYRQNTSAHAVFHYRFTSPRPEEPWTAGLGRGVYDREDLTFALDELTIPMHTAYGLPEFDTLSFESALLIKAFQDLGGAQPGQIAAFNPGQGHLPVILWRLMAPQGIDLVDRDLLGLRYAQMNLVYNGCPEEAIHLHHQTDLVPDDSSPDLVVGVLREEEGPEAIEAALLQVGSRLRPDGLVLIAGGSTPVTRVLKSQAIGRYLRAGKRRRAKGNSAAVLHRR